VGGDVEAAVGATAGDGVAAGVGVQVRIGVGVGVSVGRTGGATCSLRDDILVKAMPPRMAIVSKLTAPRTMTIIRWFLAISSFLFVYHLNNLGAGDVRAATRLKGALPPSIFPYLLRRYLLARQPQSLIRRASW
jgi:hypothetical protein